MKIIYKAKPYLNSARRSKIFESKSQSKKDIEAARDASLQYLSTETGYRMTASDWIGLGKLEVIK